MKAPVDVTASPAMMANVTGRSTTAASKVCDHQSVDTTGRACYYLRCNVDIRFAMMSLRDPTDAPADVALGDGGNVGVDCALALTDRPAYSPDRAPETSSPTALSRCLTTGIIPTAPALTSIWGSRFRLPLFEGVLETAGRRNEVVSGADVGSVPAVGCSDGVERNIRKSWGVTAC